MVLSGRRGGGVLPPLLASSEDRKESGWTVAETPWHPDMIKAKETSPLVPRLPLRCRYRVAISAVTKSQCLYITRFRIAQLDCLPAMWLAEIKQDDSLTSNTSAENYLALLGSYIVHERLLLR